LAVEQPSQIQQLFFAKPTSHGTTRKLTRVQCDVYMALTLDLNPLRLQTQRNSAFDSTALDVALSPTQAIDLNAQFDLSQLVLPAAASFSPDQSLARLISTEVSAVDLNLGNSPLRAIAFEFLSTQVVSLAEVSNSQPTSRVSEARAIIEEMERKNALREIESLWSLMLNTNVVESPAVVRPNTEPSEYEAQLGTFLAA
jgi:hypothetical protein